MSLEPLQLQNELGRPLEGQRGHAPDKPAAKLPQPTVNGATCRKAVLELHNLGRTNPAVRVGRGSRARPELGGQLGDWEPKNSHAKLKLLWGV